MKLKIKRNLLTVILAVLCAAAAVLGVAFALPKNEIKSANAATFNDVNVKFGTIKYFTGNDSTGVGSVTYASDMTAVTPNYITCTPVSGIGSGSFDTSINKGNASFLHRNVVAVPVILSVTVPAYSVYKIEYNASFTIPNTTVTGYCGITNGWTVGDSSLGDATLDGFVYNGPSPTNLSGTGFNKSLDSKYINYGMLLYNSDSSPKIIETYAFHAISMHHNGPGGGIYDYGFGIDASVTEVTQIDAPTSTNTTPVNYDGTDKVFNFTYDTPVITDFDDTVNYTTAYKNIDTTIEALDYDGKAINTSTYNLNSTTANGTLTAKEAGKYKVKFNLKQTAKDAGIRWTDGTVCEITITLE